VLERLKSKQAFYFSLVVEVYPPPEYWPTSATSLVKLTRADTMTGVVDTDKLKLLANHYKEAKIATDTSNPEMDKLPETIIDIITSNSRYAKKTSRIATAVEDNNTLQQEHTQDLSLVAELFTQTDNGDEESDHGDVTNFDINWNAE